ncbi:MAG: extracellular solute-binding protein, partial [Chloroflexota bacterium]|nr:extracellular solute-binding protein [Chloroflexota bacterium]
MHKLRTFLPLLLLLTGILGAACTARPTEVPTAIATTPPAQATPAPPTPTATPVPPTLVTIWHDWPRAHEAAYTALVAEFNAAHDDVRIKLVQVESLDAALEVALPAGEGPDVLAGTQEQLGRRALAGEIAPLDATFDMEYLERTFEPAAARAVVWDGRVWGIPETQDGIAPIYNRDLLSAIPDDFATLLEEAQAFRAANPDRYYLCNQGLGQSDAYYAAPIYFGHGMDKYGGYVDDQGNVYLNTEESYAAGAWIKNFSE